MKTHIYALCNPITYECRYVGKTVNLNKRFRMHCNPRESKLRSARWIKSLHPLKPEMIVLEEVPPGKDWAEAEQFWIAYMKVLGAKLTNITIGGKGCQGYKQEFEHIEKVRIALTGRKTDPEVLARLSIIRKGKPNPNKDIPLTEEHKAKLSVAQLARFERERALGITQVGKIMPPESILKMSISQTGRIHTPERNEKVRQGLLAGKEDGTGRYSPEAIFKKAEALKAMWVRRRAAKDLKNFVPHDIAWEGDPFPDKKPQGGDPI